MQLNLDKIPLALAWFFGGTFINIIFYYIFSPQEANLIGILSAATGNPLGAGTEFVIWFGIMIFVLLVSLFMPFLILFENE